MRIICAVLCISALALTAGCQSLNQNVSAAVKPPAPLASLEHMRLGPPPTDFKSEFGLEGQRSNKQVGVSIKTYKVMPKGFFSHKFSWDKLPEGAKLGPIISPEAEMKVAVFKVDNTFALKSLPAYLQGQGETSLSGSNTTYTIDGMVTPFATYSAAGYLSKLQCNHDDTISLVPGSVKRGNEYVLTPKIASDKVVFLSIESREVRSASEPSICNEKNEPDGRVEAREGRLYEVSANLSRTEALVISGVEDEETEKDGSIKVVVITAQEMLADDADKK